MLPLAGISSQASSAWGGRRSSRGRATSRIAVDASVGDARKRLGSASLMIYGHVRAVPACSGRVSDWGPEIIGSEGRRAIGVGGADHAPLGSFSASAWFAGMLLTEGTPSNALAGSPRWVPAGAPMLVLRGRKRRVGRHHWARSVSRAQRRNQSKVVVKTPW